MAERVAEADFRSEEAPRLAFVLGTLQPADLFDAEDMARLAGLCRILNPAPLRRFDEPRAPPLLADAEILVTGWGCPRIDASVLGRGAATEADRPRRGLDQGLGDPGRVRARHPRGRRR